MESKPVDFKPCLTDSDYPRLVGSLISLSDEAVSSNIAVDRHV